MKDDKDKQPDDQPRKPGSEPERLKIEGSWEDAVRKALEVEPPVEPQKQPK